MLAGDMHAKIQNDLDIPEIFPIKELCSTNIYLFKVNNRNPRKTCEIHSKLNTKCYICYLLDIFHTFFWFSKCLLGGIWLSDLCGTLKIRRFAKRTQARNLKTTEHAKNNPSRNFLKIKNFWMYILFY